jgi:hypothetical protein
MSQLNNIAISAGSPNRVFNLIEIRLKKRNEKGPTKNDISDTGRLNYRISMFSGEHWLRLIPFWLPVM